MFLSANKIKELVAQMEIGITPFSEANLKGASYTFTLDNRVKFLKSKPYLDSRDDPECEESTISENGYELKPGEFAIFYTKEKVNLNGKYVCILSTRATIAQMGLDVIQTSFLAEPDTNNPFALETTNNSSLPVRMYPGTKIVKGVFSLVDQD